MTPASRARQVEWIRAAAAGRQWLATTYDVDYWRAVNAGAENRYYAVPVLPPAHAPAPRRPRRRR